MIRTLLITLFFIIGLGVAAVTQGSIGQLRQLASAQLPDWTNQLSPASRISAGRLVYTPFEGVSPLTVNWQFQRLGWVGTEYRLRVVGDGVALQGKAVLPWSGGILEFRPTEGNITLGSAIAPARAAQLSGTLDTNQLTVHIDIYNNEIIGLSGVSTISEGRFDGRILDPIKLTFAPTERGAWQGELASLGQTPLALTAAMRGRFDSSLIDVDGRISEAADMPENWQRQLNQRLAKSGAGWVIKQSLDLRAPRLGQ